MVLSVIWEEVLVVEWEHTLCSVGEGFVQEMGLPAAFWTSSTVLIGGTLDKATEAATDFNKNELSPIISELICVFSLLIMANSLG